MLNQLSEMTPQHFVTCRGLGRKNLYRDRELVIGKDFRQAHIYERDFKLTGQPIGPTDFVFGASS